MPKPTNKQAKNRAKKAGTLYFRSQYHNEGYTCKQKSKDVREGMGHSGNLIKYL